MVKRLGGALAVLGVAIAAAVVKGVVNVGLDALGWVGLIICVGLVVLIGVSAFANRSTSEPSDAPPLND